MIWNFLHNYYMKHRAYIALIFQSLDPASETDVTSDRKKTKSKLYQSLGEEIQGRQSRAKEHLTFYPKPIPAPQILPITRTVSDMQRRYFCSFITIIFPNLSTGLSVSDRKHQRSSHLCNFNISSV